MTPYDPALRECTPEARSAIIRYMDDWRLWHLADLKELCRYLADCGCHPESPESTYTTVARVLRDWLRGEKVTVSGHEVIGGLKEALSLLGLDLVVAPSNVSGARCIKVWCAPLEPFDSAAIRGLYAGELPFVAKTRPIVLPPSPELAAVFVGIFGEIPSHPILATKIMVAFSGMAKIHPLASRFVWQYDTRNGRIRAGRAHYEAILNWATEGLEKETKSE